MYHLQEIKSFKVNSIQAYCMRIFATIRNFLAKIISQAQKIRISAEKPSLSRLEQMQHTSMYGFYNIIYCTCMLFYFYMNPHLLIFVVQEHDIAIKEDTEKCDQEEVNCTDIVDLINIKTYF